MNGGFRNLHIHLCTFSLHLHNIYVCVIKVAIYTPSKNIIIIFHTTAFICASKSVILPLVLYLTIVNCSFFQSDIHGKCALLFHEQIAFE